MRTGWNFAMGLAACALLHAPGARACGGLFQVEGGEAAVTRHTVVVSTSATRTVLWDQVTFSGSPESLAWVMPVRPGATVAAANTSWIDALETATDPRVAGPVLPCAGKRSAWIGCGSTGATHAALSQEDARQGDPVRVVQRTTTGPYELETLRSSEPGAVATWLTERGFTVPAAAASVLDAYTALGMDFAAVRLFPDRGVQTTTPIRVITEGSEPELPLRMMAVGAAASVNLELLVVADGRRGLGSATPVTFPMDALTFDFDTGTSNYDELRDVALESEDGTTFLTTFARGRPFDTDFVTPTGFSVELRSSAGRRARDLSELYFAQGVATGDTRAAQCEAQDEKARAVLASSPLVEPDSPAAFALACDELTDLSIAMVGHSPTDVWLTRMELSLTDDALRTDLRLGAADADAITNLLVAPRHEGRPRDCPEPLFESRIARERSSSALAVAWLSGLALAAALRRRTGGPR